MGPDDDVIDEVRCLTAESRRCLRVLERRPDLARLVRAVYRKDSHVDDLMEDIVSTLVEHDELWNRIYAAFPQLEEAHDILLTRTEPRPGVRVSSAPCCDPLSQSDTLVQTKAYGYAASRGPRIHTESDALRRRPSCSSGPTRCFEFLSTIFAHSPYARSSTCCGSLSAYSDRIRCCSVELLCALTLPGSPVLPPLASHSVREQQPWTTFASPFRCTVQ